MKHDLKLLSSLQPRPAGIPKILDTHIIRQILTEMKAELQTLNRLIADLEASAEPGDGAWGLHAVTPQFQD